MRRRRKRRPQSEPWVFLKGKSCSSRWGANGGVGMSFVPFCLPRQSKYLCPEGGGGVFISLPQGGENAWINKSKCTSRARECSTWRIIIRTSLSFFCLRLWVLRNEKRTLDREWRQTDELSRGGLSHKQENWKSFWVGEGREKLPSIRWMRGSCKSFSKKKPGSSDYAEREKSLSERFVYPWKIPTQASRGCLMQF